jgi:hypothetical protein
MAAQQRRSSPPRLQLPRRPLLILPRAAAAGRPSSPARRSTPCCPLCPAFFPHGKQQDQCRPGPCSSPLPHKTAAAASPPSSMASSLPPDAQELFSLLGTAPLIHSPGSAAALPFVLHSPRRVSSLSCSLRSPIRDAVETRGENPPPPPAVLDVYFPMCVMFNELPPINLCVFAASGRCCASRLAHSTKCRAMWTVHAAKSRLVQVESM